MRTQQAQAGVGGRVIRSHQMPDGMIGHLGAVARRMRKAQGIKLLRLAYPLDKSEPALSRFESGQSTPHDLDAVIDAYANELGISPVEVWATALESWRSEIAVGAGGALTQLGESVAARSAGHDAEPTDTPENPVEGETDREEPRSPRSKRRRSV